MPHKGYLLPHAVVRAYQLRLHPNLLESDRKPPRTRPYLAPIATTASAHRLIPPPGCITEPRRPDKLTLRLESEVIFPKEIAHFSYSYSGGAFIS